MDNITTLPVTNYPRRYALIKVKGITKLACHLNDEWIIDTTRRGINEMLQHGLVSESSITGWISMYPTTSH